jgi:hypothetical protein
MRVQTAQHTEPGEVFMSTAGWQAQEYHNCWTSSANGAQRAWSCSRRPFHPVQFPTPCTYLAPATFPHTSAHFIPAPRSPESPPARAQRTSGVSVLQLVAVISRTTTYSGCILNPAMFSLPHLFVPRAWMSVNLPACCARIVLYTQGCCGGEPSDTHFFQLSPSSSSTSPNGPSMLSTLRP